MFYKLYSDATRKFPSVNGKRNRQSQIRINVKYSGCLQLAYLNLSESATLEELRDEIKKAAAQDDYLYYRNSIIEDTYQIVSGDRRLSTEDQKRTLQELNIIDEDIVFVCDPDPFLIRVHTNDGRCLKVEAKCYQTFDELKIKLCQEGGIAQSQISSLSYIKESKEECSVEKTFLVQHEVVNDAKMSLPICVEKALKLKKTKFPSRKPGREIKAYIRKSTSQ